MAEISGEELREILGWLRANLKTVKLSKKGIEFIDSLVVKEDKGRPVLTSELCAKWKSSTLNETKARICKAFGELPSHPSGRILVSLVKILGVAEFKFRWGDRPPKVIGNDIIYFELIKRLPRLEDIEKVILIQHHGASTEALRSHIYASTKASIELYVQSPISACCRKQRKKIDTYLQNLPNVQNGISSRLNAPERLKVFAYDIPASIRAVLLDDRLVGVGWYMCHPGEEMTEPLTAQEKKDERKAWYQFHPTAGPEGMDIWGNMLPTVYAEAGSEAFQPLSDLVKQWLSSIKPSSCRQVYPLPKASVFPVKVKNIVPTSVLPKGRPHYSRATRHSHTP
jgi:hypothetical protein